jgi:hypothetical protein
MQSVDFYRRFVAVVVIVLMSACGGAGTAPTVGARGEQRRVDTTEVAVPIPDGYKDTTAAMQKQLSEIGVSLEGPAGTGRQPPVIVFQKASIRGGEIDEASCAERGRLLVDGGPQIPGRPAKLRATAIVMWSRVKGCEYDYVTPDGIPTLMTEFHDQANTPDTPLEIWTMICQHDDGDQAAIVACRSARSGFVRK